MSRRPPATGPSRPLVVVPLALTPVVSAGLGVVLRGHGDRVRWQPERARGRFDVGIVDPALVDDRTLLLLREAPVVALSSGSEEATRRAGIDGLPVVGLGASTEVLVSACEQVAGDGRRSHRWEQLLSERESQVLTLICCGCANNEIAERLHLSINTVKTYVRTAYRKIGAVTRPQAVLWGLAHGYGEDAGELSRRV